ncbi:hypothetical protein HPB51_005185 [Rhipicephalus microplus]|uniref:Uncharacterized protein n=1 Tax=Rhipicephalus microplus TaxID=6941 RepID=A0A9J6EXV4_RHIMP|nr:hypothetical protein HPB51_005185 [Rhipicephalus microplus]
MYERHPLRPSTHGEAYLRSSRYSKWRLVHMPPANIAGTQRLNHEKSEASWVAKAGSAGGTGSVIVAVAMVKVLVCWVFSGSTEEEMRRHLLFAALAAFAFLNSGYAAPHESSSSEDSNAIAGQDDYQHDDGGFPKEPSPTETEKSDSDSETTTSSTKDSSSSHQDEEREENRGSSETTTGADSGSQDEELEQKDDSKETTTQCDSTSTEGDNGSEDEEGDKTQEPSETTKPGSTANEADSGSKDEELEENDDTEETTTECGSTSTEGDNDSQDEQREEKEGSDSDKELSPLQNLSKIITDPFKNLVGK